MKLKKSLLAAIVSAAIGLGAAGQANAGVYAGSAQTFFNFLINVSPPAESTIGDFNFNVTNTAQLNNGPLAGTGANCGGTVAANSCGAAPNVLVPIGGAANAIDGNGGTPTQTRAASNYTGLFGPGGGEYSNSNSRIEAAQLVTFTPSVGQLIAESELQTPGADESAAAGAEVSSLTSFTWNFTTTGTGTLSISFDGTQYLLADINESVPPTAGATARASTETRFTLTQNTGGSGFWQWSPQGDGTGCVSNLGMGSCNVDSSADFDANNSVGTATIPVSSNVPTNPPGNGTANNAGSFAANTGLFLTSGEWSLTLFNKVSTVVTRREAVPEPSTLLLLGAGLAGLGFGQRRKKKS